MSDPVGCIFCKIVRGELPATIVLDRDDVLAFEDLSPKAPTHVLLIPKKHIGSVSELEPEDGTTAGNLLLAARDIAKDLGLSGRGYRLAVNTGSDGGQSVGHLHVHLLGGRPLGWPPG